MPDPGFTVEHLPRMRQLVTGIGWIAKQNDPIIGLLEIDVTEPRARIRTHEAASGVRLSFTAFLVACVACAVDEHKLVHASRDWRGRLVIFDDVDVTTMMEIEADGRKTPVGHIVRDVLAGGIMHKPGVVNREIAIRDYLNMTVAFDHSVIDGAPAARFAVRLQSLIEEAHGLPVTAQALRQDA